TRAASVDGAAAGGTARRAGAHCADCARRMAALVCVALDRDGVCARLLDTQSVAHAVRRHGCRPWRGHAHVECRHSRARCSGQPRCVGTRGGGTRSKRGAEPPGRCCTRRPSANEHVGPCSTVHAVGPRGDRIPGTVAHLATRLDDPRTRLIPDNPYNALLGIEPRESGPPPYLLSLADVDPATPISASRTRWYRNAGELHGDRLVQTARGATRAHIDITLGTPTTLVQRGTLVVLLDLLVIAMLWALSAFPAGVFLRWTRTRTRRWSRSFRARLTLVLFGFFVLPAMAFALWSYQRLQSEDAQSRALLVREALRSYVTGDTLEPLTVAASELGMPLLVFRNGEL